MLLFLLQRLQLLLVLFLAEIAPDTKLLNPYAPNPGTLAVGVVAAGVGVGCFGGCITYQTAP